MCDDNPLRFRVPPPRNLVPVHCCTNRVILNTLCLAQIRARFFKLAEKIETTMLGFQWVFYAESSKSISAKFEWSHPRCWVHRLKSAPESASNANCELPLRVFYSTCDKKRPVCAAGQSYWCDKIAQFHIFLPLCFPDKNALSLSQSHMCTDHLIWLYKTEKQLVVNPSSIKLSACSHCVDLLCKRYKVQSQAASLFEMYNYFLIKLC